MFFLPDNHAEYGLEAIHFNSTESWTKVVWKGTTPAGWGDGIVAPARIRFDNNGSIDRNNVVLHVRNIKLEYGNIPTDWTPAPEDAAPAILNQRDGSALKVWTDTAAQLPANRDARTIYFVV
ncbi:MAG: hypothetical protein LBD87_00340 [Prevotellaceae bacterium]|jgi:hypothetical protein|nr:hypothetical protein [Prevotellaceae bacterium]